MIIFHFLCTSCKENSEHGETATRACTLSKSEEQAAGYFKKCHMPLGAYISYIPPVPRAQNLHLFVIVITPLGARQLGFPRASTSQRNRRCTLCACDCTLFPVTSADPPAMLPAPFSWGGDAARGQLHHSRNSVLQR